MYPVAEDLGRAHPVARHIDDFLTDLANAGASGHTLRAALIDLAAQLPAAISPIP
jgi:integrase/recombinase XerD